MCFYLGIPLPVLQGPEHPGGSDRSGGVVEPGPDRRVGQPLQHAGSFPGLETQAAARPAQRQRPANHVSGPALPRLPHPPRPPLSTSLYLTHLAHLSPPLSTSLYLSLPHSSSLYLTLPHSTSLFVPLHVPISGLDLRLQIASNSRKLNIFFKHFF